MSRIVLLLVLVGGLLLSAEVGQAQALIECPFSPGSGDHIGRGFYVQGFPASALDRVLLKLSARASGEYVFRLTARAATYDGALVGQAVATVPLGGDSQVGQVAVFDFHGTPAPQGDVVTFALERVAGPDARVFNDVGAGPCSGGTVVQTEDTTPPLSTHRRDQIGLVLLAPEPETDLRRWVAVASRSGGAEGSQWRTDLVLRNRAAEVATATLRLHRPGGVESRDLSLQPGQHLTQTDVVGFLAPAFNGSAALEVVPDRPLDVTSRTYNLLAAEAACFPGATFGQVYPGQRSREGFADGQTAVLIGLQEWAAFRTNLGLTNTSATTARVVVRLFDDGGTTVHTSPVVELAAGAWRQLYRPFRQDAGRGDIHSGRAEVEVLAGTGVLVHASVIDNLTSDAATVWATP